MQKGNDSIPRKMFTKSKDYKSLWGKINEEINNSKIYIKDLFLISEEDSFASEIPFEQDYLTDENTICQSNLDWSLYCQTPINLINTNDQYDCFHGVLAFINYNSDGKLNKNEIEFHFSGAKARMSYQLIKQNPNTNQNDEWNILNIFNYENINSQFVINCTKNAFFGFTFKRILVNPVAYSIKSGKYVNTDSHLVSFAFLGFDESTKTWDVLDERANINNLIPSGGFSLFFVRKTHKYYSSFQIMQTDTGSSGFYGFKIAAVDVHGIVSYRTDIDRCEAVPLSLNFEEEAQPMMIDLLSDLTPYI